MIRQDQEIKTTLLIKDQKYELAHIQIITIPTLLDIVLRYGFFPQNCTKKQLQIQWGVWNSNQNKLPQRQIEVEELELLISQFKQKHLKSIELGQLYFKIKHKFHKSQEKKQIPQVNEVKEIKKIETKVNKEIKVVQAYQIEKKQQKDIKELTFRYSALEKIIKKIQNYSQINHIQQVMKKDDVPQNIIQSITVISKKLNERKKYKSYLKEIQENVGNLYRKIQMYQFNSKIRQNRIQLQGQKETKSEKKIKEIAQFMQKLMSEIDQVNKKCEELQQQKIKLKIQYKNEIQNNKPKFSIKTLILNQPQKEVEFSYMYSLLSKIQQIKHIQVTASIPNINMKIQQFLYILNLHYQKKNSLLVFGFGNFTLAIFSPLGVSKRDQIHPTQEQEYLKQGIIAELRHKKNNFIQISNNKNIVTLSEDPFKVVVIGKQVFTIKYDLYYKSFKIKQSQNQENKLLYVDLYQVAPEASLQTLELYQVHFYNQ